MGAKEKLILLWDTFVMLSIIPSTFFVSYQAIFNASLLWQWPVIYIGDFIYIIASLANFFRSYMDDRGRPITDRMVIAVSYLRGHFFYDLLTIVPFEVFAILAKLDDLNFSMAIMRLNRIFRLYKVWVFICKRGISLKLCTIDFFFRQAGKTTVHKHHLAHELAADFHGGRDVPLHCRPVVCHCLH